MKSVLISIRPEWCQLIADGKKTIEVRKTRPNLETPFRCYIYCTKPRHFYKISECMMASDEYLHLCENKLTMGNGFDIWDKEYDVLNGNVIGEFVCDEIYMLAPINRAPEQIDVEAESCLTREKIVKYLKGKGYAWHISDLKIYDKPMEIGEYGRFYFPPEKYCEKELCGGCPHDQVADQNGEYEYDCDWKRPILKAPQSWCYVEEVKNA